MRGQFLEAGRHAKVVLKDDARIKSLRYTFNRSEKDKGVCIVHSMPSDYVDIKNWLRHLNFGISYRAKSLQGICYKVLVCLVKQKERRYLGARKGID